MCVIIYIPKNKTFPYSSLQNAVWNNPHGFGLVTYKGKKLEVIKELPEGGTDPEYIKNLLDDRKKYDRFLHLRWKTEGEISLDNVQPFSIWQDGDEQAWFMHNGTLQDYKPNEVQGVKDPRSDSRIFAETFLKPLLDDTNGEYTSSILYKVIHKFWGVTSTSRGLILSNYDAVMFINVSDWKILKATGEDGNSVEEFRVSNLEYFDQVKRGYEHDRREQERKTLLEAHRAKKALENQSNNTNNVQAWPLSKIKDINFKPNERIDSNDLASIMGDTKLWSDEGLALLGGLSYDEIEHLAKQHTEIFASLFEYTTNCFATLRHDYETVIKKHEDATKLIASLKNPKIIIPDDHDMYNNYSHVG